MTEGHTEANELKAWMARDHWSVRRLADYIGVNPSTVQKWRDGTHPIPGYMWLIIIEA